MEEAELAKAALELARAKIELGHDQAEFLSEITDDQGRRIKLQRMSLEELQSVPYIPGKTMEEIQAELKTTQKKKSGKPNAYQSARVADLDASTLASDSLFDDTLTPGEFDPQDVVQVDKRPYSYPEKPTKHGHIHSKGKHLPTKPNEEELVTIYQKQTPQKPAHSHKGHGHSHQHGESCSHDHGHDHSGHDHEGGGSVRKGAGKSTKMTVNRYRNFLRAVIITVQFTHYGFEIFYIAPRFSNPFYTWVVQVFVAILWFVTTYSHLQVSLTKSNTFKRAKDDSSLEVQAEEYKTCDKCLDNNWKPPRAKHCSVQGHDVLRFDHYCPVTLNTVGYRTHGAFLITAYCHMVD